MKNHPIFILLIIATLIRVNFASAIPNTEDPLSILFIGNSHFLYHDLPASFKQLVDSSHKDVFIDSNIRPGALLTDHARDNLTESKINSKKWDFVVLQGVGPILAYPDSFPDFPLFESMRILKEKILQNHPRTKIVFCMPWAYEDGMVWYKEWTDTYVEMQIKNYTNTLRYCNELELIIAPVGWSWYKVLEEKGYPLHYLHESDWSHPNPRGAYLMACVFYSTIYRESSEGNGYIGTLPISEGNYFQEIASTVVLKNLGLWNITVNIDDIYSSADLVLAQNYPNPFSSSTRIDFELFSSGPVELTLYNLNGKKVKVLLKEFMSPGTHSITTDRGSLPNGIYFYSLRGQLTSVSRKLIIID